MNRAFFSRLTLADVRRDLIRNIVSLRVSQDLFDDLSTDPEHWRLAQRVEGEVKPPTYRSATPVLHRPFEDAAWFNAIDWPFKHWQASRFSDGSFGVWYGADTVETSVFETAYHWYRGLIQDAGFEHEQVVGERKVYAVTCTAALLDFRPLVSELPDLVHRSDYGFTQSIGARLHREGHPGLLTLSARREAGENYAILNAAVLSDPRHHCQLTYRLKGDSIVVERKAGSRWLKIGTRQLEA